MGLRFASLSLSGFAMVVLSVSCVGAALAAAPAQCPFTPAELKAQLGATFDAGVPESGIIGKACTYKSGSVKLWLDAGPAPMPAVQWRKMSSPSGTVWKDVAGDADKAVHETPPSGVSPYPALSYERGGWLVKLTMTGVNDKAGIEAWNAKLVKLRRIP